MNEIANNVLMKAHDYVLSSRGTLRYGQALYNAVSDVSPETAKMIANTELDPFYNTPQDFPWDKFWEVVENISDES